MTTVADPRRPRRDLTVREMVDRAGEIMAAEGESALTMRRVAAACGVTPMALYHHVDNREDLLTLVVDRVVGSAFAEHRAGRDWRETLAEFCCAYRRALLDNPGAAAVYISRPILSPNLARVTEYMFATLAAGGVTGRAASEAVVLLALGSVANDLSRPPDVRERLMEQLAENETPLMAGQIDSYAHRDGEERFRLALGWLFDGIEHDLAAHAGRAPG
jgi:AcrR family transcriptional regulator